MDLTQGFKIAIGGSRNYNVLALPLFVHAINFVCISFF